MLGGASGGCFLQEMKSAFGWFTRFGESNTAFYLFVTLQVLSCWDKSSGLNK